MDVISVTIVQPHGQEPLGRGDDSSGSINNNGSFVIEALTSFSATRSSSVYGKSQHVQPPALYALTIIKS